MENLNPCMSNSRPHRRPRLPSWITPDEVKTLLRALGDQTTKRRLLVIISSLVARWAMRFQHSRGSGHRPPQEVLSIQPARSGGPADPSRHQQPIPSDGHQVVATMSSLVA